MFDLNNVILGIGFGDEGKGLVTSHVAHTMSFPIVVRFSGGQQAGHNVVKGNLSHIFSNFGSGTLHGVPTYWSKFCTFDPVGVINEWRALKAKGIDPVLYIDMDAPITTPYDKTANQIHEALHRHGTVGVGIGKTWQREEAYYSLKIRDLLYPKIFKEKMKLITLHYIQHAGQDMDYFYSCINEILANPDTFRIVNGMPREFNPVFEGSQGLLLDKEIGFFPHVTYGPVGLENVIKILGKDPNHVFLVTRAYQTRHGNGPMTNEDLPNDMIKNINETNKENQQGVFRKTILDLDLLQYAITKEPNLRRIQKTLVITCLDQVYKYMFTIGGQLHQFKTAELFTESISELLRIKNVMVSYNPETELFNLKM